MKEKDIEKDLENIYFANIAFPKQKNLEIEFRLIEKENDNIFTIDLFDTDNGEINFSEKGDNSVLAQLLDQYFTYIHGKGINGTFIPSLVGVFKIKINTFKTLLVFITKNSIVENAINNNYSHSNNIINLFFF